MADTEKLKPKDFPVHTEQKKIVKNDALATVVLPALHARRIR
jgi:hypothetical protein